MTSTAFIKNTISDYNDYIKQSRIILLIVALVLIIAVIIISLIFGQNFSMLIKNLSRYLNNVAQGNLNLNLKSVDDVELNGLADSFNTLVEELRDKKEKESDDHEESKKLFQKGVGFLKDNNLEDAIAIFRTLHILKPERFSSLFNLAVAYAKNKDFHNSMVMFETASVINPESDITKKYLNKVKKHLLKK